MSRTHAYPATTRAYPARARHYSTATPAGPQRASLAPAPSTFAPTLRFLGLLLLLTPLLGGVNVLVHPPAPLPPEVVTQIVEVTRPVYVPVPVPTLVVVEVPVAREPAAVTTSQVADASSVASPVEAPEVATVPESEPADAGLVADVAPPVVEVAVIPVAPAPPVALRVVPQPVPAEPTEAEAESPVEAPAEVVAEVPVDEPVEVAAAPDSGRAPALAARRAVADFYAYTDQNWSVKGYSSADEMREELGNSGSGWLDDAKAIAASAEPEAGPAEEQAESPPDEPAPILASLVEAPPQAPESEPAPAVAEEPLEEPIADSVDEAGPVISEEPSDLLDLAAEEPSDEPEELASEPAPSHSPGVAARQAVANFNAHIDRSWSIQGYSSADEMREALGNSRSGWLAEAEALAHSDESDPTEAEE